MYAFDSFSVKKKKTLHEVISWGQENRMVPGTSKN